MALDLYVTDDGDPGLGHLRGRRRRGHRSGGKSHVFHGRTDFAFSKVGDKLQDHRPEALTRRAGVRSRYGAIEARPRLAALVGATFIAFSGIFFRYSGQSPSTATVFRCLLAVPFLAILVVGEDRRARARGRRERRLAIGAGVCFAADLISWQHAVLLIGAGLATVVANFQVVVVAALSWAVVRGAPRPAADPRAFRSCSSARSSSRGSLDNGAYGQDPGLGVAVRADGGGRLLRLSPPHPPGQSRRPADVGFAVRRVGDGRRRRPLGGPGDRRPRSDPGAAALGWLLLVALTSQVAGYGLINLSLPRLPAAVTSVLLLAQPFDHVSAQRRSSSASVRRRSSCRRRGPARWRRRGGWTPAAARVRRWRWIRAADELRSEA